VGSGKDIVVTAYGHKDAIDNIAVSLFDKPETGHDDAETYCDALNKLKLEGESWVFAKIVSENTQYPLDAFSPIKFDTLFELDERSIQRVLRETDCRELAMALKGVNEIVLEEKIFRNMSARTAQMLKEEMEFTKLVEMRDVKKYRENIANYIRRLMQIGEIVTRRWLGCQK